MVTEYASVLKLLFQRLVLWCVSCIPRKSQKGLRAEGRMLWPKYFAREGQSGEILKWAEGLLHAGVQLMELEYPLPYCFC